MGIGQILAVLWHARDQIWAVQRPSLRIHLLTESGWSPKVHKPYLLTYKEELLTCYPFPP